MVEIFFLELFHLKGMTLYTFTSSPKAHTKFPKGKLHKETSTSVKIIKGESIGRWRTVTLHVHVRGLGQAVVAVTWSTPIVQGLWEAVELLCPPWACPLP